MNKIDKNLILQFIETGTRLHKALSSLSSVSNSEKLVTGMQMHGLKLISDSPGITVGEFAETFMFSSASAAQFIKRLEDSGWLERVADDNDKRIFHLHLTSKGEEELKKLYSKLVSKMEKVLAFMSEDDFNTIIRIQNKLLKNIEKSNVKSL